MQNSHSKNPRVALITGAARRIGAKIARVLHANGFNIVIHYHQSDNAAQALCAELNAARADSATRLAADLSVQSNLAPLVKSAADAWGRLDVLVNNAARFYRTKVGDVTEAAWDDLLASNLKAPFFLAQAAAPYLSQNQGCIVNIADVHGIRPMRDYAAYCISKAGLVMLTQVLAKELAPTIRVNAVSPGPTVLPEGDNALSAATLQKIIERTALERMGDAAEIAQAVGFFVQDANYITGQVLAVDGGRSLMI